MGTPFPFARKSAVSRLAWQLVTCAIAVTGLTAPASASAKGSLLDGLFAAKQVPAPPSQDEVRMEQWRSLSPTQVCNGAWAQFYANDASEWAAIQPLVQKEFPRTVSGDMTMADAGRLATSLIGQQRLSAGAATITVRMANLDAQEIASHLVVCGFDFAMSASSSATMAFRARIMIDVRGAQVGRSALREVLPATLTEQGALAHNPEVYFLDGDGRRVSLAQVRAERSVEAQRQRQIEIRQRQVKARSDVLFNFFDPRRDCGQHVTICRYVRLTYENGIYGFSRDHWQQLVSTLAILVGRTHPNGSEMAGFRTRVFQAIEGDAARCKVFGERDFIDCMDIVVDANANTIRNTYDIDR